MGRPKQTSSLPCARPPSFPSSSHHSDDNSNNHISDDEGQHRPLSDSNASSLVTVLATEATVTMQNRWNNRISDGCVYAQIRKGLGMHLVTYSNHDTVPFLLIVPIKGGFV